jgi:ATP-dependent RNA helicase DDX18/HAS1
VFEVAKKACEFHNKTIGILIGGTNRKTESNRLEKGVNMLICTPGRLLDHLQNSKFNYKNLLSLVIDEADALLRQGFEE